MLGIRDRKRECIWFGVELDKTRHAVFMLLGFCLCRLGDGRRLPWGDGFEPGLEWGLAEHSRQEEQRVRAGASRGPSFFPPPLRPGGRVQLAKCFVCHAKKLLFTYLFLRERARACAGMLWGGGAGSRERKRGNQHRTRHGAQSHEL